MPTTSSKPLNCQTLSVKQLFSRRPVREFKVPEFQSSFSWRRKHVDDLWNDFQESLDEKRPHFLGSVVLRQMKPDSPIHEIFDCQQRLTVTMALIAVIKHACEAHLEHRDTTPERSRQLQKLIDHAERMLYVEHTGRRSLRLKMNAQNHNTFRDCIAKGQKSDGARTNVFLRTHVFHHLRRKLQERLSEEVNDSVGLLERMLRTVEERFYFVVVMADTQFSTATLFETMNFRGTSLKPEDLLKSLLYATASDQGCQRAVENTWERDIVKPFESGRLKIDEFLKAFWIAQHRSSVTGNLYTSFRRDIASTGAPSEPVSDYVDRIAEHVRYFRQVAEPMKLWPANKNEQQKLLEGIRLFGGTLFQPLLMVLAKYMDERDLLSRSQRISVFRAIETVAIRDHVCGRTVDRNQLIKMLNLSIERLQSGVAAEVETLPDQLRTHLPSDKDFSDAFAEWSCDKSPMAKHILWRIEQHKQSPRQEPLSDNPRKITLEHIMPQKLPERGWKDVVNYHRRFVNRIGNLTLLGSGLNITNGGFVKKKHRYYCESLINLTRDLLRFEKWRKTEIVERQKELAKLAVKIWRIDD